MNIVSDKELTDAVRAYAEAHDKLFDVLWRDNDRDALVAFGGLCLYQTKNNDRTLAAMRKMAAKAMADRHDWADGSRVNGKEIK